MIFDTRILLLAGALLVVPFGASVSAQDCDPGDETQSGMNICAAASLAQADAELNTAYRELTDRLASERGQEQALRAAQRAWIAFRDAECAFATISYEGGSMRPMLVSACLEDLTRARTKQIRAHLECPEGDVACAGE